MTPVIVRGVRIGEGIPKVCVPLVGVREEEVCQAAAEAVRRRADVVEWRVDWFEDAFDWTCVERVLIRLRRVLGGTPLLFTFRTAAEGGQREICPGEYEELNLRSARSGLADLLDVELFSGDGLVRRVVEGAHQAGVGVIASSHDFKKTPPGEELIRRMRRMEELGADILKIAVMPENSRDVLELLTATEEMSSRYTERPIITMSMSKTGLISRLCGEVFGSALTFGAVGKASAPGQIEAEELKRILELLHRSMG